MELPEPFFAETWERSTVVHRGSFAGSAAELLTLDQFEALAMSSPAGPSSRLNVVDKIARPVLATDNEAAAVSAVYRAYHAGSTLLLIDLHRRWPSIARLCRDLETELLGLGVVLSQPIGANAYLTPARSQGFDIHYDHHCVFIVQLAGAKQWQVCAPLVELPIDRCEQPIPADQLDAPILETELLPGDVLYIPRGFPHSARTHGESSLHLTISLHTMTWLQVVEQALRSKRELRRSVRRGGAQAYFDAELRAACAVTGLDEQIERKTAELVTRLVPMPQARLRAIDGLAEIARDTRVERVAGALCIVRRDGDQVVMEIPGATLRLPVVMEDAFRFIASAPRFSAAELPLGRAVLDPVELVRILVKEGLLSTVATITQGGAS